MDRSGINNSFYGKKHTEETKKKMKESRRLLKERLGYLVSKEAREKISKANKGVPKSEEHKRKVGLANSIALKGRKQTEEFKQKMRDIAKNNPNFGMRGKHQSKESILKMSLAKKGKHTSEETKNKLSISGLEYYKNNKVSEETRRKISNNLERNHKISISRLGKHLSDEHKKNLSISKYKDKNPNWKGGKSLELYGIEFNKRFKNIIRKRDNQVCMNCGIHRERINRVLSVHHINYDKLLSIQENCISLCDKCHALTNFNREYWIKLFQDKLNKLYGYNYSEEGLPIIKLEMENLNG